MGKVDDLHIIDRQAVVLEDEHQEMVGIGAFDYSDLFPFQIFGRKDGRILCDQQGEGLGRGRGESNDAGVLPCGSRDNGRGVTHEPEVLLTSGKRLIHGRPGSEGCPFNSNSILFQLLFQPSLLLHDKNWSIMRTGLKGHADLLRPFTPDRTRDRQQTKDHDDQHSHNSIHGFSFRDFQQQSQVFDQTLMH